MAPGDEWRPAGALARATLVTAAAFGLGTVLGLLRDLLIAGYFGADGDTDAFLVAWALPETAVPLLIDSAMTLLMIPMFSRALQQRRERTRPGWDGPDHGGDPVAEAVASTLPRLVAALVVISGLVAMTAPWLVMLLAPGLSNPALAVASVRAISASVVFIGIAGYFVAALRAHLVYGPPALVTVAMNVGIVGLVLMAHRELGVLAAVLGATLGSALMVAVQLPAFVRHVGLPRRINRTGVVAIGTVAPIAVYILLRQGQVFVERWVASWLQPGTITHLNYVQKIGQVPYGLAMILAVVTFPRIARSVAAGDTEGAARRVGLDIHIIAAVVLAATAYLFAFAPQVVQLLLQRGAFTAADGATTSAILRVYVWGLLGQAVLEIMCRLLFSQRVSALPAVAMAVGLLSTALVAGLGVRWWGAEGIAAANAVGITVAAILVVCGRRDSIVAASAVSVRLLRLAPATLVSTLIAQWLATRLDGAPPVLSVGLGAIAVSLVFAAVAMLTELIARPPGTRQTAPTAVSSPGTSPARRSRRDVPAHPTGVPPLLVTDHSPSTDGRDDAGLRTMPWVLMYHSIADSQVDPHKLAVSPAAFERQLRWLLDRGLRGCTISELLAAPVEARAGLVGLTFDDGYRDFAETAVPILRRFGFTATVYALAGRLGGANEWDPGDPPKPLLTARQLREVAAAGMEVGSHGLTHVALTAVPSATLARELRQSRVVLTEILGRPVRSFAYPYGELGDREVAAVCAAGYDHACAVARTPPTCRYAIPRTYVGQRDARLRMAVRKIRHDRRWGRPG